MRRFLKPVLVTIGAASAAFLIANPGSPINAAPAARAKTITICTPEEQPEETANANIVTLPTIPLPAISLPQLPCIPLPQLPSLHELLPQLPPVTLPSLPNFQLPNLPNPLIPPIPAIGFPGFPDCSNQEVGQSVFQFEPCPNGPTD